MRIGRGLVCECEGAGACPGGLPNGTCTTQPGGYCFAAVEEVLDDNGFIEIERTAGCLPPEETGFMQCKSSQVPHQSPKTIECCTDSDLCNRALRPRLAVPPPEPADTPTLRPPPPLPALLVAAALCVALLAFLAACLLLHRRRRARAAKRPPSPPAHLSRVPEVSSGSGSGLPLLVQRTVGKQIQMIESVGKGRYGEVWAARWRGEMVAVKVFFTTEEASWFRETEIYQTVPMRHENVLGFVAADIKGTGSWTQMLLITEYHERGSLYDYLHAHAPDERSTVRMAQSIAAGLAHLHTEIVGARGKPAIAHRDLKSKNVLVKRDGTCAIADFGLAVRYVAERDEVDVAANARVGTRRYMPPEALDGSLCVTDFEALKAGDVYSLALVLWELCRRCAGGGAAAEPYAPPYHEYVSSDPDVDEMRAVVCERGVRPAVCARWTGGRARLTSLATECWAGRPAARLSAMRVHKSLSKLLEEEAAMPPPFATIKRV